MEQNNRKPYVYICCSQADLALLESVKKILDAQGISYVYADFTVAGSEFASSASQLQAATACLILMTEKSVNTMELRGTLGAAMRTAVPLVLVQSEDLPMTPGMKLQISSNPVITTGADMERKLLQALQQFSFRQAATCDRRLMQTNEEMNRWRMEMECQQMECQQMEWVNARRSQSAMPPMYSVPPMSATPPMPGEHTMRSVPSGQPMPAPAARPKAAAKTEPKKEGFFARLFGKKQKEETIVPPPTMDSVQFSAVADRQFTPGCYLPIDVVMYEDAFRKVVDDLVETKGGKGQETKGGYQEVARNARVRVVLTSQDIPLDADGEERIWMGKYLEFSFVVKIPGDYAEPQLLLTASVYINDLIATRLRLILSREKAVQVSREDVTSAFVSYASQDRGRVAAIIQGMRKARPDLDIFFDIETLRSGQEWEKALWEEIDKRDVLFLCWSHSAKASPWVEKEWRYALSHKGDTGVEPIPIDPPDTCPPPPELQQKHFNDKMLYIIKANS